MISIIFSGISIYSNDLVAKNACAEMLVNPAPIFTLDRLVQNANALHPRLVTLSGITTSLMLEFTNASSPIVLMLLRSIDEIEENANAYRPTVCVISGMVYASVIPAGYATSSVFALLNRTPDFDENEVLFLSIFIFEREVAP